MQDDSRDNSFDQFVKDYMENCVVELGVISTKIGDFPCRRISYALSIPDVQTAAVAVGA